MSEQIGVAENGGHRGSDLVAHVCQKFTLSAARGFGDIPCLDKFDKVVLAFSDVLDGTKNPMLDAVFFFKNSNYFKADSNSSDFYANNRNYEELIQDEKGVFIDNVAIQKKVITDPFLKIFVVYRDFVEDNVFKFNEGLKPEKDIRGLGTNIQFNSEDISATNLDSLKRKYIETFNEVYVVTIDSTDYVKDFIFSQSMKSELGFETYVNIDSLEEGRHLLKISRKRISDKDTTLRSVAKIPFWYFRD